MNKTAKFNIGELVMHTRQGYCAVVVDVDPQFQASGRYNPQASKRNFAQRNPWYRLLVDGTSLETYVEETLLKREPDLHTIENPHIDQYLIQLHGNYFSIIPRH